MSDQAMQVPKSRAEYMALAEESLRQARSVRLKFDEDEHDADRAIALIQCFLAEANTYTELAKLVEPEPPVKPRFLPEDFAAERAIERQQENLLLATDAALAWFDAHLELCHSPEELSMIEALRRAIAGNQSSGAGHMRGQATP